MLMEVCGANRCNHVGSGRIDVVSQDEVGSSEYIVRLLLILGLLPVNEQDRFELIGKVEKTAQPRLLLNPGSGVYTRHSATANQ